jgi:hypothetical protein
MKGEACEEFKKGSVFVDGDVACRYKVVRVVRVS